MSGQFSALPEEFQPILPLLKKSVEHMRKNNGFAADINGELLKLNRSMVMQNRLMWVGAVVGLILLSGLVFALFEQRSLRDQLEQQLHNQEQTNRHLIGVVRKLEDTYVEAREAKEAIEDQPKITVKPADSADPFSKPVLVVEEKPKTARPDKPPPAGAKKPPVGVEIPLDLPKKR